MPVFPNTGGGGAGAAWETNVEIYASPTGSNSNTGTGWSAAKGTIYAGIAAVNSAGGGTLYVANGTPVGNPLGASYGIRLRSDFVDGGFFAAQGFQPFANLRIVGAGKVFRNFSKPANANIGGSGGGDLTSPAIWVVGSGNMNPLIIEGLQKTDIQQGAYIGVDLDRNLDGTVKTSTVTNATRTGTATVLTVTLPAQALTVTRAERTSNVTTLTIPNPGLPWPPWREGVPIVFTSGDADFASGAYVITDHNNPLIDNDTWTVSYAETGADAPDQPIAASSLKTHGVCAGEMVHFYSTSLTHFKYAPYYVSSVNANGLGITLLDTTGDGDQNVNNCGTIAHQERYYCGTTGVRFSGVSFGLNNTSQLIGGQSYNIGHNASIAPVIEGQGWSEGYVGPTGSATRDERSMSQMYVYPGTATFGPTNASVTIRDCFGTNGQILVEAGSGPATVDVRRFTNETVYPALSLPLLRVDGNGFTNVVAQDLINADATVTVPTVTLTSIPQAGAQCERTGIVSGACIGGDYWWVPGVWASPDADTPPPWAARHNTQWADGRITGKYPGVARALGPVAARFANVLATPSAWTLGAGTTRTLAQPAPDGSSTAVKLDTVATGYTQMRANTTDGATWAVGGKLVVCGWVNAGQPGDFVSGELFKISTSGVTFITPQGADSNSSIPTPYTGTGWQYVQSFLTVDTVSDSTPDYVVSFRPAGNSTFYLWGMTAYYVPPGNDGDEIAGCPNYQPVYLLPGMTGTMEGGKFIAHGGLGIATGITKVVGVGSGQLTLTGTGTIYEPRYDADGTTILGWVALLQATVNA